MNNSQLTLHHVGFVVQDVAAGMNAFTHSLAAAWNGCIFEDPNQKVRVAFLSTRPGDPQIELIEPASDDSPVANFLRNGGGLHHVCYEVADLEQSLADFKSRGSAIARRPKPAVAFNGRRIAWVLTAERLLVELLEQA